MSLSFSARFGWGLAAVLLVVAVAVLAQPSSAGTITFTAPSITLAQSPGVQTGYFDVMITETGGSDLLNGFQVDLLLPSQNNITFIGADLVTQSATQGGSAAYVFNGNSSDQTDSVAPFQDSNEASNADVPNNNDVALSPVMLGLIRIEYSIAANFVGTVSLTLNQDNPNTDGNADYVQLNTDFVDVYSPTAVNGSITVTSPEPATWMLAVLGAVGLFGVRRLRARQG